MKKTTKIVLTGGPCAGKTTALAKISEHFSGLGFQVYILPEAATLFSQSGVNFLTKDKMYFYQAEKSLLEWQLQIEEHFTHIANAQDKPSIIVCDRGTMDISAYLDKNTWSAIMDEKQTNEIKLRDARYDAVIHMVTAARGAEEFYTNANNEHRTENIEQAQVLDNKLINVWTGHPHLRVIENKGSFEQKINDVLVEISNILGVPNPIETERKYIVEVLSELPNAVETDIFQTYLKSDRNEEIRIRKRGSNGSFVYFFTSKKFLSETQRIETEKQITPREYVELLEKAEVNTITIHKKRHCFVWQGQYFEIDTYITPNVGYTILEIEGVSEHQNVAFPPFIKVLEDVTGNKKYYNYEISKQK